jgi:hypothetical protein
MQAKRQQRSLETSLHRMMKSSSSSPCRTLHCLLWIACTAIRVVPYMQIRINGRGMKHASRRIGVFNAALTPPSC